MPHNSSPAATFSQGRFRRLLFESVEHCEAGRIKRNQRNSAGSRRTTKDAAALFGFAVVFPSQGRTATGEIVHFDPVQDSKEVWTKPVRFFFPKS